MQERVGQNKTNALFTVCPVSVHCLCLGRRQWRGVVEMMTYTPYTYTLNKRKVVTLRHLYDNCSGEAERSEEESSGEQGRTAVEESSGGRAVGGSSGEAEIKASSNASSTHQQRISNASSTHHQTIMNASSTHHQGIINASSTHHQRIINASSTHQRIINASSCCSELCSFWVRPPTTTKG
jgi:hypothetical protein